MAVGNITKEIDLEHLIPENQKHLYKHYKNISVSITTEEGKLTISVQKRDWDSLINIEDQSDLKDECNIVTEEEVIYQRELEKDRPGPLVDVNGDTVYE